MQFNVCLGLATACEATLTSCLHTNMFDLEEATDIGTDTSMFTKSLQFKKWNRFGDK